MKLKIITTSVIFSLLYFCAKEMVAQSPGYDTLRVPDIYDSRVELFRAMPATSKDIVLLGNSITFWGEWNLLLNHKHIRNHGIPGDTSFGVLKRLDEAVRGNPSAIFLLIGINDIGRNFPDSLIARNYERIVRFIKIKSPRTKIFLQSVLPTNPTFDKMTHVQQKEKNIAYLNSRLQEIARREQINYIDLHSHFTDQNGHLKAEYTWDGVHLTLAGYRKWVEVLDKLGYVRAKKP